MKPTTSTPATSITHPSGLHVSITIEHSSIKETPSGFIIYIQPTDARQQNYILIEQRAEKPENINLSKVLNAKEYLYSHEVYEGGSGGTENILQIWKSTNDNGGFFIEHYSQDDLNEVTDIAWEIAVSIEAN